MYLHMFDLPNSWSVAGFIEHEHTTDRAWKSSEHICALSDNERHLGHIVKTRDWHAYDATHFDAASSGFKYLGQFSERAAAMEAVEAVAGRVYGLRTMRAIGLGLSLPS